MKSSPADVTESPSPSASSNDDVLLVRDVSIHFGGVAAVRDVSLRVGRGEIVGLVGENGAGKSSLLKLIFGEQRPDSGTILLGDAEHPPSSPRDAISQGVAMISQELALVPEMTVAQNLVLGDEPGSAGFVSWRNVRRRGGEILVNSGFEDLPLRSTVNSLRPAQRQMVEVARAAARGASLVIMDEPTSSLGAQDSRRLMDVAAGLRERNTSVVYVSHRLAEVLELSDRIVVMRDGRKVADLANDGLTEDELVELMIGRPPSQKRRESLGHGQPLIEIEDLVVRKGAKPVSFAIHEGEVVGLGGLVGSGRSSLIRAISGASRPESGVIRVRGAEVRRHGSPLSALKAGIVLVPEDRRHQGLMTGASIIKNVSLSVLHRCSKFGFVNSRSRRALVSQWTKSVHLRARTLDMNAGQLSGGNQQKVVLAKVLATKSPVVLVDEPTRGIDVGAKDEIYNLLEQFVEAGNALFVASSETAELIRLCDRVIVMQAGSPVAELVGENLTEARVGQAMLRTNK